MSIPTGHQLSTDHRDLMRMQRERLRGRIVSDNLEATDVIRPLKILAAKEAIERGAMDTPDIWDTSTDLMIVREGLDGQYDERAAERDLMDRIVENDIEHCGFLKDFEP